jgi:hypothetical protein
MKSQLENSGAGIGACMVCDDEGRDESGEPCAVCVAPLIEKIVEVARRPRTPIVAGQHGGFVFRQPDGVTYSPKFFATTEQASAWIDEARAATDSEFRSALAAMTVEQLQDQATFWIKAR